MNSEAMSNEDNYAFDVAGYLHVPGVLNQEEVAVLNAVLVVLRQVEFEGFRHESSHIFSMSAGLAISFAILVSDVCNT